MTKDEALKLALKALERGETELRWKAITAIKEALAQPEQEPVAWMQNTTAGLYVIDHYDEWHCIPLYTTPPQRKPLTDTRVKVKLGSQYGEDLAGHWFFLQPADNFADAALAKHSGIEAAHGIKGEA